MNCEHSCVYSQLEIVLHDNSEVKKSSRFTFSSLFPLSSTSRDSREPDTRQGRLFCRLCSLRVAMMFILDSLAGRLILLHKWSFVHTNQILLNTSQRCKKSVWEWRCPQAMSDEFVWHCDIVTLLNHIEHTVTQSHDRCTLSLVPAFHVSW